MSSDLPPPADVPDESNAPQPPLPSGDPYASAVPPAPPPPSAAPPPAAPPPPPSYSQPGYPQAGYAVAAQTSSKATTAMVLGIVGLVVCSLVGIAALVIGNQAKQEIDASGGQLGGRGQAVAGIIMGWVAIGLMAVGLLALVAFGLLAAVSSSSGT
jgi:hypothetical protein